MSGTTITTRRLGSTELWVTNLCIGTSALGSQPAVYGYAVTEDEALETLRRVLEGPINFVDTSNGYADGESERRIGTVLRELGGPPSGYVVATKVDPDASGDFSGRRVRASVAESCERLGMERLPLVYLHDPEIVAFDAATAPDGPVEALKALRDEGIVDHLGVAGGQIDLLRRYAATGVFEVVITHNRFTLLDRSAEPLMDDCVAAGIALVNGAPFGGGMLAKGVSGSSSYAYRPAPAVVLERAAQIEAVCGESGVSLAAAALQFSMRDHRVASTIVGVTKPERVQQTLELAQMEVPQELWDQLAALAAPEDVWLH